MPPLLPRHTRWCRLCWVASVGERFQMCSWKSMWLLVSWNPPRCHRKYAEFQTSHEQSPQNFGFQTLYFYRRSVEIRERGFASFRLRHLRSPEDLPCTSPSLCCLYNAGSRTPSCIFDFVCKAVRLGFSFTKTNFQVSVSPQVLNVITGQEGRTAVEQWWCEQLCLCRCLCWQRIAASEPAARFSNRRGNWDQGQLGIL